MFEKCFKLKPEKQNPNIKDLMWNDMRAMLSKKRDEAGINDHR